VAILDPELTVSQPRPVASLTGLDALAHALETAVCTRRNPLSAAYSREALLRLSSAIESVLQGAATLEDRGNMVLGAAFSGLAIENSMLGAAHASANPLTARFGLVHGHAVAVMLPHVLRFNRGDAAAAAEYEHLTELLARKGFAKMPLQEWVEHLLDVAELPSLGASGVGADSIPSLADDASRQWTGNFNPRPLEKADFEGLYEAALGIGARV
jgi:alcohol dehydrogenase